MIEIQIILIIVFQLKLYYIMLIQIRTMIEIYYISSTTPKINIFLSTNKYGEIKKLSRGLKKE